MTKLTSLTTRSFSLTDFLFLFAGRQGLLGIPNSGGKVFTFFRSDPWQGQIRVKQTFFFLLTIGKASEL